MTRGANINFFKKDSVLCLQVVEYPICCSQSVIASEVCIWIIRFK